MSFPPQESPVGILGLLTIALCACWSPVPVGDGHTAGTEFPRIRRAN